MIRNRHALKNNQTIKEKNWNDTALNIITRKNDLVTIETIYRYGKTKKITISYSEFRHWRRENPERVEDAIWNLKELQK